MKPEFFYPVKPHFLTQGWGIFRPEIYAQFGFNRHNGLDHGFLGSKNIYAPCDGTVLLQGNEPKGGGIYVAILSHPFSFPEFTCSTPDKKSIKFAAGWHRVRIDFLHLEKILVKPGDFIKAGDLIAIGDNTGFSTGPHCHTTMAPGSVGWLFRQGSGQERRK
jgi:murein DD-endopeptidase MepM/ murein hydrolase activator NlpD